MKYFNTILFLLGSLCALVKGEAAFGQQASEPKNAMTAGPRNYTSFTPVTSHLTTEALNGNKGYEHHPEAGKLFAEAPCGDCYELIGKRTENSKTFIKEGTNGKKTMLQTSTSPMHYKDARGNWMTIKTGLSPDKSGKGVYAANEQEAPVSISATGRKVSLGVSGKSISFNNEPELIYEQADGTITTLGKGDWSHYTAGDDGVYVTDMWPGIDMEVFTLRGAVKTNFIINHALAAYAGGKLLIRDHLAMDAGLSLNSESKRRYTGNLSINDHDGNKAFMISAASAFEKKAATSTLEMLEYGINGDTLDIAVPGELLNRNTTSYPVIIDPLVSVATVSSVNGSTYSSSFTSGCAYLNPATVPAQVSITDIQFSFSYVTSGGALLNNGAFDFRLGSCRSPTPTTLFWTCNSLLSGTCTGTGASIYTSMIPCLPPPQCTPFDLNITMNFYQDYLSTTPCSNLYISAGTSLTITVFGNTVDAGAVTSSASPVCQGQPTTLSTVTTHGVPPYTYSWMPGALPGASVTVTPTTTTTYTVTTTDACGNTATATKTISVNPTAPITGTLSICMGSGGALSDAIAGGTWTSAATAVATIGSASGTVTTVSPGAATISYTTAAGCVITATLTVLSPPAAITGTKTLCQLNTVTLSNAVSGGTWTSGNSAVAVVSNPTIGSVFGLSGGTATITYSAPGVCAAYATVTVYPVASITGPATVCVGGSAKLSDAVAGGAWSSSNTTVATIFSSTGIAIGVAVGTTTISYTTGAGCVSTTILTVNLLTPITGTTTLCQGTTSPLSDATTGGTWTSSNSAVATIGSSTGVVTGMGGGTTTISYTAIGGCYSVTTVTVNPVAPITGPTNICLGSTVTYSDAAGGGTWLSGSPGVASINTFSGSTIGMTAGTAGITYTTGAGCATNITVTVVSVPVITGGVTLCQGSATTLSNATTGGTWTSGNTLVATAGGTTGIVTGTGGGTATISYTLSSGCSATTTVTVYPLAPITGMATVCVGSTTALSDATPGGTWTSGTTTVATIDPSTGVVTGVAAGTSVIQYTTSLGCVATITVSVNALFPTTGTTTICQGSATILSNITPGGTWSSGNTAIAVVTSTGSTSGVSAGTAVITYTTPGGCYTTVTVTVNPLLPITGVTSICQGYSTTLSNATPGGMWSSGNTAIATVGSSTGIVSGVGGGSVLIRYTTPAGCIATVIVTINPLTPILGNTTVCQGNTTTFSNATGGGLWSSGNTVVATIGITSGVASGLTGGTTTITYTTSAGCATTATLTVFPMSPITGVTTLCQGYSTTLSNATPGGTWTSGNTGVATIGSTTGVVIAVSNGTSVIQYTTVSGCTASVTLTVNPLGPITGTTTFCNTTTLSNSTPGGAWSSSNTGIAIIGATSGIATSVSTGTCTITYTTTGGCYTTATVTTLPSAPITGVTSLCAGSGTFYTNTVTGGTWSSGNTAVATIDPATGLATAIAGGVTVIAYSNTYGCTASLTLTVSPSLPITGSNTVCQGSVIILSNGVAGGTWSSGNTTVATITLTGGALTGMTPGTATIAYTTPAGCVALVTVTVNPITPITGIGNLCMGSTTTYTDATTGGAWSSGNTAVATIDPATGVINAVSAGTTTIQYLTTAGCAATKTLTVDPIYPITGKTTVCQGSATTLINAAGGGLWSSGSTTVATIGISSGVATGMNPGTSLIVYTTSAGCTANLTVTVYPLAAITGVNKICAGDNTTFSDATPGGTWTSANTAIATIDPVTGTVNSVTAGTVVIAYTTSAGCTATVTLSVNAMPGGITGGTSVCQGSNITLGNPLGGGTWTSANTGVATIGISSGIVTGISTNTTTITYTTSGMCYVTTTVTVNPLPAAITGTTSLCQGATTTLSDATPGGTWSSVVPGVATVNALSGFVTAFGTGTTNIIYTTPRGCQTGITVTVFAIPSSITGTKTVCEGASATLFNTLAGGTWTSSDPGVASIGLSSGLYGGITAGTATITYQTPAGCFATTTVRVNTTPIISGMASTNPTTCVTNDGTITLHGLAPLTSYTVNYLSGSTTILTTIVSTGTGDVVITGLAAGAYSNFVVTTPAGCASNPFAGPASLVLPPSPATPTANNNSPICAGQSLDFTATDITAGVTYVWVGPGGYTSTSRNPSINPSAVTSSGVYSVTAVKLGCVSDPATTTAFVHAVPNIARATSTDPTTCFGVDGTMTLEGLEAGVLYELFYVFNSTPETTMVTANAAGKIVISKLSAGVYANIFVTYNCVSNTAGPVSLKDPLPAPAPDIESNSPICTGKTLRITTSDPVKNLTYEWTGPNGFTSGDADPVIPNVTLTDSGLYSLTIKHLNCASYSTHNVVVHPPTVLTDVTPSTTIPKDESIMLHVSGAEFYIWSPNDGSLSNPNIDSPVASPTDNVTYSVTGTNRFGCLDTAYITLTVDNSMTDFVPNAFTPNNDGKDDIFRLGNVKYDRLADFKVFNRWGQVIYHNTSDPTKGWDGTYNGVPQDMGTYTYSIILIGPDGKNKILKGDVLLLR